MEFTSGDIKQFILENIENHPSDISGLTGEKLNSLPKTDVARGPMLRELHKN